MEDFQIREDRRVIADLIGKGKHIAPSRSLRGRNAVSMSGLLPLASIVA
jgi:hypothetical protein